MKKYVVVPRKSEDDIEKYEEGSTNVVEFKALDYQGHYIYNMAELHIVFGANAVEGLGNELLRSYISGKKLNGIHLQSSYENYIFEDMGICVSPKSPDIVLMEKDLDMNDLIKETTKIQEKLYKLFDENKILEDEKYDLKNFIINEKILYGRLELLSYSVIKLNKDKCKILNKSINDTEGFEISTIELISKL
ncbi:MAG: hypothetical protein ACLUVC_13255 [Longibaculum sp.]